MVKASVRPDKHKLTAFCRKHHIRKLSLFGSLVSGNFGLDSDVDVLVEFEPDHTPGFFNLFRMEEELSKLFGGRKVDLRTPQDLSRYFRDEVMKSAEVQYAAK